MKCGRLLVCIVSCGLNMGMQGMHPSYTLLFRQNFLRRGNALGAYCSYPALLAILAVG